MHTFNNENLPLDVVYLQENGVDAYIILIGCEPVTTKWQVQMVWFMSTKRQCTCDCNWGDVHAVVANGDVASFCHNGISDSCTQICGGHSGQLESVGHHHTAVIAVNIHHCLVVSCYVQRLTDHMVDHLESSMNSLQRLSECTAAYEESIASVATIIYMQCFMHDIQYYLLLLAHNRNNMFSNLVQCSNSLNVWFTISNKLLITSNYNQT